MEYFVKLPPKECLDRVTAYMVGQGYSVENQSECILTFKRRPQMPLWLGCLAILSGGLFLVAFLVAAAFLEHRTTLAAYPMAEGKTRLVVGGQAELDREQVERWVVENLPVATADGRAFPPSWNTRSR
jgi:hypothetical protein